MIDEFEADIVAFNKHYLNVLCGYIPCSNNKPDSELVYQQHRRFYVEKQHDETCPQVQFREDLLKVLMRWREEEKASVIVCLDANEDIYRKSLGKALGDENGLNMMEVVGEFTGKRVGATFFRGSKPIDGVWCTWDVVVSNACVMPVGYGVGDHRMFVVDFCAASMVGSAPPKIVRPPIRRLNTKIPRAVQEYNKVLRSNIKRHQLVEKLQALERSN